MYEIIFVDTFALMASSIENLSDNLRSEDDLKLNIQVKLKNAKAIYAVINILTKNQFNQHEVCRNARSTTQGQQHCC